MFNWLVSKEKVQQVVLAQEQNVNASLRATRKNLKKNGNLTVSNWQFVTRVINASDSRIADIQSGKMEQSAVEYAQRFISGS